MDERLITFLYILMRDHLPTGTVADVLDKHLPKELGVASVHTNKQLMVYAAEIAARIRDPHSSLLERCLRCDAKKIEHLYPPIQPEGKARLCGYVEKAVNEDVER